MSTFIIVVFFFLFCIAGGRDRMIVLLCKNDAESGNLEKWLLA